MTQLLARVATAVAITAREAAAIGAAVGAAVVLGVKLVENIKEPKETENRRNDEWREMP